MGTLTKTKKPAAAKAATIRARRAAQARRRRAEDKADYELAAKRCADIDSGKTKVHSREEVLRELGLPV